MIVTTDSNLEAYDIAIYEELFDKNSEVKNEYENIFKAEYANLERIYNEMKESKGFAGEASEGFLSIFEILLKFHKDCINKLPDLYKSIEDLEVSLENIKTAPEYKRLEE